eukprot:CAMPEP_0114158424 /NCGR_PEP_ID=MMETSP0043_2-20121206/27200_1 /TAXON_ID=464988 /ORGANISM="Hemiselmis andersenii, Strain CCMP644" /LENGTH=99 /DNA_ID=CAMNT_0001254163 /DNA_START=170 /DNA_END=465 /DNA_ORIENTATION=+
MACSALTFASAASHCSLALSLTLVTSTPASSSAFFCACLDSSNLMSDSNFAVSLSILLSHSSLVLITSSLALSNDPYPSHTPPASSLRHLSARISPFSA